MRKFILFVVFALFAITANAEKVVGTYTMAGMPMDIEAAFDSKGELNVYVEVMGEYKNDKVMIRINGEKDLDLFISKLQYCKEKYVEWSKVAKDNNVKDYSKEFDVTFPNVEIYWLGAKWYSTYKRNHLKPLFLVGSEGDATLGAGGKAKHWDNEYIDQQWYLILISASEFDGLISALNPAKIKSELNKNDNADALFQ